MSDKIQQEIEELLAKLDELPSRRPMRLRVRDGVSSALRGLGGFFAGLRLPRISLGQILLLGIALVVIAYVARPGDDSVTRIFIIVGIVLFLGAFILSLRRSASGGQPPEKRWRGQPMELGGTRLRSWWDRWRSRR